MLLLVYETGKHANEHFDPFTNEKPVILILTLFKISRRLADPDAFSLKLY